MDYKTYNDKYGIKRDIEGVDDCELEVTKQAMMKYLNYPCYKTWEPFLYGGTREQYLCYSRILKNGYRGDKGYKGAYLLRNFNDTVVLTADILTEIKSPIKKLVEDETTVPQEGEAIKNAILEKKIDFAEDDIQPYAISFAKVYYWIGNMLPVPTNPKRLNDRGTWRNKVLYLRGERKTEINNLGWENWDLPKDWKNSFFLQDAFNDDNEVKPFYDGLEDVNQVYMAKSDYNHKRWLLNNAKFIIQRSYRIVNNYNGNWNGNEGQDIKNIFETVFEDINEDDKLTLF